MRKAHLVRVDYPAFSGPRRSSLYPGNTQLLFSPQQKKKPGLQISVTNVLYLNLACSDGQISDGLG